MNLIDSVDYTTITASPGINNPHNLRIYALTTCAFCERALSFLKDQGLAHEYLMVDSLDPETKRELKAELKAKYGNIPVFPLLIVDHETAISGFTEDRWREAIGL